MMKKMVTLGQAATSVKKMTIGCHDHLVRVPGVEFKDLNSVVIDGDEYELSRAARVQLAEKLGVPLRYLHKCPPSLQSQNLNYWLEQYPGYEFFIRFQGQKVRAFLTPRYQPNDNLQVIEKLYEMGYSDRTAVNFLIDDELMAINIPMTSKSFDLKGDQFIPGISVVNSEVGLHALSVKASCLRLVCTNGMIDEEVYSQSFRHITPKIVDRLPQVVNEVCGEIVKQRKRFLTSKRTKLDDPLDTINEFNDFFKLSARERRAVLWGWDYEQGNNMFAVVNTYTRAAQMDGLPVSAAINLQRVGGLVLSMTA